MNNYFSRGGAYLLANQYNIFYRDDSNINQEKKVKIEKNLKS